MPAGAYGKAPVCSDVFMVSDSLETAEFKVSRSKVIIPEKLSSELQKKLDANYEARNEILAKRYPQLEFVFKDPEAFVSSMKQRFDAQKKITPEDPRVFNFPEAAPTMKELRSDLEKFRLELVSQLQLQKRTLINQLTHTTLGKRSEQVETITKTLQYVKQLQSDIDTMISVNNFPYRDTVYTLYYYSRIRGIFQFKELGTYYQIAKYIDMWMHGYRRLNVDNELRLYESKESPILQVRSAKISHEFRVAELPFRDAFERKDTLEYVVVPSIHALGSSALMHVLPHKIHIFGATNTPIEADGFKRPGGLFWMHDVRHESDRYMKISAYKKAQNLTASQEKTLSLLMHQWHSDFLQLKKSTTDEDVKEALEHYHFYTHHDVGVPLIPSMFLNHHKDGIAVYYTFLWHKKNAGQTPKFKNWFENTKKAQAILTQFWQERLPLEKQLLQKDPVKINNWEEWFPMSHRDVKTPVALFNQAIESKLPIRMNTENSAIEGTLSKVVYAENGQPMFVQFSGKVQLVDGSGAIIQGQGTDVHSQGYSTPIGEIKSIKINGLESDLSKIAPGQTLELEYNSGITVRGELKDLINDVASAPKILSFKSAEIKAGERTLYKPGWSGFDLLMSKAIQSVEFLY